MPEWWLLAGWVLTVQTQQSRDLGRWVNRRWMEDMMSRMVLSGTQEH